MKLKILLVEDDKIFQKLLTKKLSGHIIDIADNYDTALNKINFSHYEIVFLDLNLGKNDDYSGLKLIPLAVAKGMYCVVMSISEEEEIINKAYNLGCMDYYGKDSSGSNINAVIERYLKNIRKDFSVNPVEKEFITSDPQTIKQINEAIKYASTDIPILILGDSGTGKTKLAEIIHEHSQRKGAFISINCSSYTPELLEAELFGYKKGSFTGAYEDKKGKLLEANGGTLFLDEIGTISYDMQAKFLKAIEEKSFYPLGSNKIERSDFRIISATNEDIQELLEDKKLRFDFFQRIHGFTIKLKPLSQRKCDIFPLIKHFSSSGRKLAFTEEARKFLESYSWTGNIRELKKFVEMISVKSGGVIDVEKVKECLNQDLNASAKYSESDSNFITKEQYSYALKYGLPEAMDKFAREIVFKNISENKAKTKTMSELKISTRFLYSILKKNKNERNK